MRLQRKGATRAVRRRTEGKKNQPKKILLHLLHLVLDKHQQEAPKSSGPLGQRYTSLPQHRFRSPPREASPLVPSPHWTATDLCQTGGRKWRCSHPGAAWEARAHWSLPVWRPAHLKRRSRRKRKKLPDPVNQLSHKKKIQVIEIVCIVRPN